jgi:Na+-translocating ferredoxin:NAD+ oxidoreductase subunit B
MSEEVYQRLAQHLDRLPAGFAATQSGVELRILRRLFTPEQAELATHLTLLAEEAAVIARRASLPLEETRQMLAEMAEKGLISDVRHRDGRVEYMAAQFVVGIWEYQVGRLTPELVQDVDEYFKESFPFETWSKNPQLRTIPVGESLPQGGEVLPYMRAAEIIRQHTRFAVAPCVCRQERGLAGDACDKPLETCLQMDGAADTYVRHGLSREISLEEALHLLEVADRAGLVLQPGNSRDTSFLCCCCGDCCGVLRNVRRHPQPSSIVSSGYIAFSDEAICSGCGDCLGRCQMDAIDLDTGCAVVKMERCIGCGLCITTCSTGAMQLKPKPKEEQPYVPRNVVENYLRLGRQRGVLGVRSMAKTIVQSKVDRLMASPDGADK